MKTIRTAAGVPGGDRVCHWGGVRLSIGWSQQKCKRPVPTTFPDTSWTLNQLCLRILKNWSSPDIPTHSRQQRLNILIRYRLRSNIRGGAHLCEQSGFGDSMKWRVEKLPLSRTQLLDHWNYVIFTQRRKGIPWHQYNSVYFRFSMLVRITGLCRNKTDHKKNISESDWE